MQVHQAIRLMRETAALRHRSISNENAHTHWLERYGVFVRDQPLKPSTTELKIQPFLARLAISGVSASTQNQASNALLFFWRDVLKQELGPAKAKFLTHLISPVCVLVG